MELPIEWTNRQNVNNIQSRWKRSHCRKQTITATCPPSFQNVHVSRPHKQSDRTSNRSYIQLQVSLHISETRLAGPAYPYELGIPRHKKRPMVHTFQWHSAGAADCSQEVLFAWLVLGTGLDETLEQSLSSCKGGSSVALFKKSAARLPALTFLTLEISRGFLSIP